MQWFGSFLLIHAIRSRCNSILGPHNARWHGPYPKGRRPSATQRRRRSAIFSARWLGPPGKDHALQRLLDSIQQPGAPRTLPLDPKTAAYDTWRDDYSPNSNSPAWTACLPTEGPSFLPPFIRGVLSVASRRYFCTCVQLAFRHTFSADYSDRFRPTAGDNTGCPCGTEITHPHITIPQALTVLHGLLHCPATSTARAALLSHTRINPIRSIFSTEAGGKALCEYIHATQLFFRPLPTPRSPVSQSRWRLNASWFSYITSFTDSLYFLLCLLNTHFLP